MPKKQSVTVRQIDVQPNMGEITPIEYNSQRILTTELLATAYEVDATIIRRNYQRNKKHYTEGIHYYYLKGEELKIFKSTTQNMLSVGKSAPYLYLWTEKGALLHAKSLNTDKAWQVYMHLIDHYFRTQTAAIANEGFSADLQLVKQLCANIVALETRLQQIENQPPPQPANNPQLDRLIALLEQQYQRPAPPALPQPKEQEPLYLPELTPEQNESGYRKQLQQKKLLTKFEAAAYIGVSSTTLNRIINSGDFYPLTRIGYGRGKVFINREKYDQWIDEQDAKYKHF